MLLPVQQEAVTNESPVLIHHPIGKTLKTSVSTIKYSNQYQLKYQTNHGFKSDMCGGGYYY
ncbi:hypothetical protein [Simkania negevensis]|uniref:hypothetical protein n=1 Tax=Simkania negevensis TaxID=83561 RepID=UPI0011D2B107|nr:hypothetical protein [Simkania negevensis]